MNAPIDSVPPVEASGSWFHVEQAVKKVLKKSAKATMISFKANDISFTKWRSLKTNSQDLDSGSVTGNPLKCLHLEGALVFSLSILLYAHTGVSWWWFVGLLLVPDVVMAGYWLGASWGAIFYNAGHS